MSFQQGLSGLNTSSKQLDVIGNNVANASTVGFKQSQAQFADMYAASLAGGGAQVGTGARVASVAQQFTQGNITNTSNPMDTAINGQGFFRMIDPSGGVLYTRNGQFQMDKDGFIVNNQGHKLSGYLSDATGKINTGNPVPIQIDHSDLTPKKTVAVVAGVNLDATEATPLNSSFNPADPVSYNRSTPLTVYDSLGISHVGSLYFQRLPIAPTNIVRNAATTASLAVPAGTTVNVTSAAGMAAGDTVTIPGAGAAGGAFTGTISSIAGNTLTLTAPTLTAVAAGAAVTTSGPGTIPLGATSVTLASAAGMAIGNTITIPGAGDSTASTVPAAVPLGATSATVALATGMSVGDTITIAGAGNTSTIQNINGNVVTFFPATTAGPTGANAVVTAVAPLTATITGIAGNVVTFDQPTITATLDPTPAYAAVISNAGSANWNTYLAIDGSLVPPSTTGATPAVSSQTTITLAAAPTGLAVGGPISITGAGTDGGTHTAIISSIVGNLVTFAPAAATPPAAGAIVTAPLAKLSFSSLGQLTSTTPVSVDVGKITSSAFTPTGATIQTIGFDFSQSSQYGGSFGVNTLTQDGYASGRLSGFSTGADGTVLGRYSNGQTRALGQMLLVNFTNPQGLQSVGNNEWVESGTSGGPLIGTPGASTMGVLQSSATEDSNVDLTAELVHMITAQRVYEANAQTIKAQDAILQRIVNLA